MLDLLTQVVEAQVDYGKIFQLIGVYLLSLWFMFCLWVFVDARKRYRNFFIALIFAMVVLVFNFPALIFYLIVRPELEDWIEADAYDHYTRGGVQVPIVHFTGEDGRVEMSLNLNLHPKKHPENDMVIDVKWDSEKETLKLAEVEATKPTVKQELKLSNAKAAMEAPATRVSLPETKDKTNRNKPMMGFIAGRVNKFRSYMEKSRQQREKRMEELKAKRTVESETAIKKKSEERNDREDSMTSSDIKKEAEKSVPENNSNQANQSSKKKNKSKKRR